MGTAFTVYEGSKPIIELTEYTINESILDADTFAQNNFKLYYDEICRTITLTGRITTNDSKEDGDVKKLINWAVLPADDMGCYKKVFISIDGIVDFKEANIRQETFDKAYVLKYTESFDYSTGTVLFDIVIKNLDVPVQTSTPAAQSNTAQAAQNNTLPTAQPKVAGNNNNTVVVAPPKNEPAVTVTNNEDFGLPLKSSDNIVISSLYSYRFSSAEFHRAWDFAVYAATGIPVYSIGKGKVVRIGKGVTSGDGNGFGNHIVIKYATSNGTEFYVLYAHMAYAPQNGAGNENNKIWTVKSEVSKNDILGEVGNTGGNYGIHLHFQCVKADGDFDWSTYNSNSFEPFTGKTNGEAGGELNLYNLSALTKSAVEKYTGYAHYAFGTFSGLNNAKPKEKNAGLGITKDAYWDK